MRATKLLKRASLFAAGFLAMGSAANAVTIVFVEGGTGLAPGEVLIANFNPTTGGYTGSATIMSGNTGAGADPAVGDQGDPYFSVQAGQDANFTFATALSSFSFDYGSADTYNFIEIFYTDNTSEIISGQDVINAGIANGDQGAPRTNGRLTLTADGGRQISGFRLTSTQNSFELDNVAITAVPEPSIWALMILGFGIIGHSMRRRRVNFRFSQAV